MMIHDRISRISGRIPCDFRRCGGRICTLISRVVPEFFENDAKTSQRNALSPAHPKVRQYRACAASATIIACPAPIAQCASSPSPGMRAIPGIANEAAVRRAGSPAAHRRNVDRLRPLRLRRDRIPVPAPSGRESARAAPHPAGGDGRRYETRIRRSSSGRQTAAAIRRRAPRHPARHSPLPTAPRGCAMQQVALTRQRFGREVIERREGEAVPPAPRAPSAAGRRRQQFVETGGLAPVDRDGAHQAERGSRPAPPPALDRRAAQQAAASERLPAKPSSLGSMTFGLAGGGTSCVGCARRFVRGVGRRLRRQVRAPRRHRPADRAARSFPSARLWAPLRARLRPRSSARGSITMSARPTSSTIAPIPNRPICKRWIRSARVPRQRAPVHAPVPRGPQQVSGIECHAPCPTPSEAEPSQSKTGRPFVAQPFGVVERGEIAKAGVAQDRRRRADCLPLRPPAACPAPPRRRR